VCDPGGVAQNATPLRFFTGHWQPEACPGRMGVASGLSRPGETKAPRLGPARGAALSANPPCAGWVSGSARRGPAAPVRKDGHDGPFPQGRECVTSGGFA